MGTIAKLMLTGSINGRNILVLATGSPGTLIHSASNTAGQMDEIYIYAANIDSVDRILTLQWGGTGSSDGISMVIPCQQGFFLVAPGLLLAGGVQASAYASAINVILINGYVHRITA